VILSPKAPEPIPETLWGSCLGCHTGIAARLHLALGSIRAAAMRPMTPALLILCEGCRRQFVFSLHPVQEFAG
jgi:hypothetical protein